MSASKICVETATSYSSSYTNLRCDIEHEFVATNVGAARARTSRSKTSIVMSPWTVKQRRTELSTCVEIQSFC